MQFTLIPKTKKRRYCNFSVSDYKETFLDHSNCDPWKILSFIASFVDQMWNHKTVLDNLCISSKTSVDWCSFCSEVTDSWFRDQKAIGGEGIEIEIDETLIARRKYEQGRVKKTDLAYLGGSRESTGKDLLWH